MAKGLVEFENQDKYFIKFFLLDASLNLNRWGVTERSLKAGLDTFIGKPFVLTPDFDHPNALDGDDLLVQQEKYRVGNIITVGIEERSGKAWGVAEITDERAKDILKNGEVNFVSPSIVFNETNEIDVNGNAIIDSFEGAHVAGVGEPAYTIQKAQIKGRCAGDKETCIPQLQKVQASRTTCGKYTVVETADKRVIGRASKCVEDCVAQKNEHGKDIDDQALAICYSECDEADASCKDDVKGFYDCGEKDANHQEESGFPFVHWAKEQDETKNYNDAFLSMMYKVFQKWQTSTNSKPHVANIDQESLDNITTVKLPKGNGGNGYSTDVKTKKCPPKKKCDVDKKAKKGHLSLKGFNLKIS